MGKFAPGNAAHRPVFEERHIAIIADAYRRGATKKAAANAAGFCGETIRLRVIQGEKDVAAGEDTLDTRLYLAIEQAEADCEMRCLDALNRAMDGHDTGTVRETVKTCFRTYKTKDADGNPVERVICRTVTHPDGAIEEIPVEFEDRTTETVSGREFDWKAAESWLKRRRRQDYGDNVEIGGDAEKPLVIKSPDIEQATQELNEWRKLMTDGLSSLPSAPPT